ncbi:Nuclear receptor coactivator 7 [Heterocephalus glaber]|uniref:Nuclear receptor coactivator 7 n=1 Tax=Heterocephalus glaber TaxID=10181 RepID=G5C4I3_HETGA|nr:Nuclear receptor coactivator 7 [Heterocephalus glaber]
MEYTAGSQDTLNSIALKFNITPNKLVELNKLFTHTIVPGQVLFVPGASSPSGSLRLSSSSPGATVFPSSSDTEYDKLPDADLARKALKPIKRDLSSTSEDEPGVVKFLKMNCCYFTDGKGVVGGVMSVTPNNIVFDRRKSDPLVIENGFEEYGLICPMEEVVSIALYNDISHMKIKDAFPSPGEWEDLMSERDLSPFSKFKSVSKEKRQQSRVRTGASGPMRAGSAEGAPQHPGDTGPGPAGGLGSSGSGRRATDSPQDPGEAPEKETEPLALQGDPDAEENSIEGALASPVEPTLDDSRPGVQMNSKSEIQLWLLKRIQVPIEDILPSKEEKSKTPPIFLCIRVGKPMRKSFATHMAAMVQQYGRRRKQLEYWFTVPRKRVDHLYTFFVQWSPDVYGKVAKEQGFVVVEKEELNMMDNFFSEPTTKSWEIITVEEAKRRRSMCSYYEDEDEEGLTVLQPHSVLLESMHIEQLA